MPQGEPEQAKRVGAGSGCGYGTWVGQAATDPIMSTIQILGLDKLATGTMRK